MATQRTKVLFLPTRPCHDADFDAMNSLPIHWSEGMFLRPHHFQAADRYWTESIHRNTLWDHPYHYGLYSLEFSREAIANYQFELTCCEARLRDGTIVTVEGGSGTDRLSLLDGAGEATSPTADLDEAFARDARVTVYLGVPKLRPGRPNIIEPGESSGEPRRYRLTKLPTADDAGGNDQEIDFRELNVKLLLSTQDLAGYEVIPIARIKRSGGAEALPEIDEDFIPSVLTVEVWPILARDYVRAIYDLISQKVVVLAEQVVSRGIGGGSQEPGDLDRLLMLMALNEAVTTLRCVAFSRRTHPYDVYLELCRIIGRLAIFSPSRKPEDVPTYDHDDLAKIFKWAKKTITMLINQIRNYSYERVDFLGAEQRMEVSINPKWFSDQWEWYVGVNYGSATRRECIETLSPGRLDWKIGSREKVDDIFRLKMQGVEMHLVSHPPRALPTSGPWVFFQVDKSGQEWNNVVANQSLAVRFSRQCIKNLSELEGQPSLLLQAPGQAHPIKLGFALFAVDTEQQ